jgi:hypothetical protein
MCRLLEGSNADLVRIFQAERRGNLAEFGSLCLAQMKVKKDHIWGHVCMSGMRKGGGCAPALRKRGRPRYSCPRVAIHIERRAYSDLTQPRSFRRICPPKGRGRVRCDPGRHAQAAQPDIRQEARGAIGQGSAGPRRMIVRFSALIFSILLWCSGPDVRDEGKQWFARELPKNGDVPKSPLLASSSPGGIGRRDF